MPGYIQSMNYVSYVRLQSLAQPEAVAVRDEEKTWTYGELMSDVQRGAAVLADNGVEAGDVLALALPNSYEFIVGTLAGLAREAMVAPINPEYREGEFDHILPEADPDAIVSTTAVADRVSHIAPMETTWLTVDGTTATSVDFVDSLKTADGGYRIPPTSADTPAFLLYTSGTTGQPSGAVHTHDTVIAVSDACAVSYELTVGDRFLAAMPLYHCTGASIVTSTLKIGGEVVLYEDWDAESTLKLLDEYDINAFSGVPTMFQDWLALDDGTYDCEAMHTAVIGGSDVTADLIKRSEALLGCPVLNGYGMTETFIAGIWEDRYNERRPPSVGQMEDSLIEASIVDPKTGEEQPPGEPGELRLRGRPLLDEYYRRPELTEEAFDGEWFYTRDLAKRDEDNYLYILDRLDDTILCGGHNVYPQEVEATIEDLDGVKQAIVVGRDDERKGQKPVAVVSRTDSGVTESIVREHCLEQLAAYKHPREVQFVDSFPLNDVGKVDRDTLRERV
ncbi:acyl--CoA ligase [Natronomonas gomsonensis]|uniref:class I adenylate-forming enzyme family protein n=1 Tax=Natronomonas gomsonensis TaxID=1046043 RepID=UPI0020CA7B2A|nr:class I adenylate-forming enzyme family protein [Natronomonas gomsonensis]MCY4731571.1 acyl--CoA ligase [Natronomonas gomsonensis]